MKQYLVFSGNIFYPSGGMEDYVTSYDTLEDAKAYVKSWQRPFQMEWWHIADRDTCEIVWRDIDG